MKAYALPPVYTNSSTENQVMIQYNHQSRKFIHNLLNDPRINTPFGLVFVDETRTAKNKIARLKRNASGLIRLKTVPKGYHLKDSTNSNIVYEGPHVDLNHLNVESVNVRHKSNLEYSKFTVLFEDADNLTQNVIHQLMIFVSSLATSSSNMHAQRPKIKLLNSIHSLLERNPSPSIILYRFA